MFVFDVVRRLKRLLLVIGGLLSQNRPTVLIFCFDCLIKWFVNSDAAGMADNLYPSAIKYHLIFNTVSGNQDINRFSDGNAFFA